METSDKWVNKCTDLEIYGFKGRGRPCKTWIATVIEDLKAWNTDANNAHDRPVWKKALRTAMENLNHGVVDRWLKMDKYVLPFFPTASIY